MSKKRVLVIEDERDMAELIATRLKREGYVIEHAYDGQDGLAKIRAGRPDLVLLDIFLPKMSGIDVLREVRQDPRTSLTPVIIVTAKGDETDVIVGLQLGADDYIAKPFNMSLLTARMDAVLRRTARGEPTGKGPMLVGQIMVDPDRYVVEVDGHPAALTPTEFRILLALASARGRILTRNQLIDQTLGPDAVVTDRTIDVHLTSMRRKLGKARDCIKTVRGIGYRLSADPDE
ncbi:MAG: response regulator transcription factor [Phycisphaerae bacterium]